MRICCVPCIVLGALGVMKKYEYNTNIHTNRRQSFKWYCVTNRPFSIITCFNYDSIRATFDSGLTRGKPSFMKVYYLYTFQDKTIITLSE